MIDEPQPATKTGNSTTQIIKAGMDTRPMLARFEAERWTGWSRATSPGSS